MSEPTAELTSDIETAPDEASKLIAMTADIVSAYVTHNSLPASDMPAMIATIHQSLLSVGSPPVKEEEPRKEPAVPIKKSITDEYIICLEDGKKFKTLKRHLATVYSLTPEQYRAKWGLPRDYPMVAPSYAAVRSSLAKAAGLGEARKAAANSKKIVKPRAKNAKPRAKKAG